METSFPKIGLKPNFEIDTVEIAKTYNEKKKDIRENGSKRRQGPGHLIRHRTLAHSERTRGANLDLTSC
jgi:hypothetical protein